MNARQKGLSYCREVRKIIEALGHTVEGPGYATAFFNGRMSPIHRDYFGLWDLISYYQGQYLFHQVSTLSNKSSKIKAITGKQMPGWIWCRVDHPVGYRIFKVDQAGNVVETGMQFIPKAILGEGKK